MRRRQMRRAAWAWGAALLCGCDDALFFLEGAEPPPVASRAAAEPASAGMPPLPEEGFVGRHCADREGYRLARLVQPGELHLEEVMADPLGVDADHEWLQVRVRAAGPVDLAGLCLLALPDGRRARRWCLSSHVCYPVAPAATLLLALARRPRAAAVPATHVLISRETLPNGAMVLELHSGGRCVARARVPRAQRGQAMAAEALPLP